MVEVVDLGVTASFVLEDEAEEGESVSTGTLSLFLFSPLALASLTFLWRRRAASTSLHVLPYERNQGTRDDRGDRVRPNQTNGGVQVWYQRARE